MAITAGMEWWNWYWCLKEAKLKIGALTTAIVTKLLNLKNKRITQADIGIKELNEVDSIL